MKRCPQCRRDYTDETLNFCLDDGTQLLDGPASGNDQRTEILSHDSDLFDEKKTRALETDTSEEALASASKDLWIGGFLDRKAVLIAVAGVLVVAILGFGWVTRNYLNSSGGSESKFRNSTLTRITTSGRAQDADISPDGKFVVYLEMADDGNRSLWVRQIATGNSIPIVAPTKGNVLKGATFSRDGNFVYYLFTDRTRPASLYQVSSVGGTPRKIVDDCHSPVAVSPDGQKLAFVRYSDATKSNLVTINADGSGETVIASIENDRWFADEGPSWSPDGKTIAVTGGISAGGVDLGRLLGVDTTDGSVRELSPKRWITTGRVVWMPDGASLVLVAMERPDEAGTQLWEVSYPSGSAVRLTNDVNPRDDTSLGVTQDGLRILSVTQQRRSRIESMPASGQADRVTRISNADTDMDGLEGMDVLSDGRIVFASIDGGQSDILIMNPDGTGRRKLTSDIFRDTDPSLSPDNRYVVFRSNRPAGDSAPRLWRMNLDGSDAIQLASRADSSGSFSPDGRWVVFSSYGGGSMQLLYKVSVDGGEVATLTDYPVFESSYSPDGRWIGAYFSDHQGTRWRYGIISAEGGRPVRHFEFPGFQYEWVRWTRDGKDVSFIGAPPDPSNIWLQPVEGGEPRKLTDFKSEYIFRHAWSRDGKTLFLVRGRPLFDVVIQTAQP